MDMRLDSEHVVRADFGGLALEQTYCMLAGIVD
jgi:hypothetical protein